MTATQAGKTAKIQVEGFGLMDRIYPVDKEVVVRSLYYASRKKAPILTGAIITPRGARKTAFFTIASRCQFIW